MLLNGAEPQDPRGSGGYIDQRLRDRAGQKALHLRNHGDLALRQAASPSASDHHPDIRRRGFRLQARVQRVPRHLQLDQYLVVDITPI